MAYTSSLIPLMTSNTTSLEIFPSGIASVSSESSSTYSAWKAFDSTSYIAGSSYWSTTTTGVAPSWITFRFENMYYAKAITKYTIASQDTANTAPKDFVLQGSNDNSSWTNLDTQTGQVFVANEQKSYTFTNTTKYLYHRLYITANNGGTTTRITLFELMADSVPYAEFVGLSLQTEVDTTNPYASLSGLALQVEFEIPTALGEKSKLYYYDSSFKRARSIKVFTGTGSNRYNFNTVSSLKNEDYVFGTKTVLSTDATTDSYGTVSSYNTFAESGKILASQIVNTCATMFQDLLGWTINFYCDDTINTYISFNYASLTKNDISIRIAKVGTSEKYLEVSVRVPSDESTHVLYLDRIYYYTDSGGELLKFKIIDTLNGGKYMLAYRSNILARPAYYEMYSIRLHDNSPVFVVKGVISDSLHAYGYEVGLVGLYSGGVFSYAKGLNEIMLSKRYFAQESSANKVYRYVSNNVYHGNLATTFPSYEVFSVNDIVYVRYSHLAFRI